MIIKGEKMSIFKLKELQEMQDKLDERIFKKHATSREATFEARVLALHVEVSELANEKQSFKYWKQNRKIDEQRIKDELADVLHFTISLGIDIDFDEVIDLKQLNLGIPLTQRFIFLHDSLGEFYNRRTSSDYKQLLEAVLGLTYDLGYEVQDLYDAYVLKYKENHQRQDDNY